MQVPAIAGVSKMRTPRILAKSGFWVTCSRHAKITDAHYLSNANSSSRGNSIPPKRKSSSTRLPHPRAGRSLIPRCRLEDAGLRESVREGHSGADGGASCADGTKRAVEVEAERSRAHLRHRLQRKRREHARDRLFMLRKKVDAGVCYCGKVKGDVCPFRFSMVNPSEFVTTLT